MRLAEGVLTLTRAAGVDLPQGALAAWREAALALYADTAPHAYRDLCRMSFAATGLDPQAVCQHALPEPGAAVEQAPDGSQLDLALQAVRGLGEGDARPDAAGAARLIVYATSSVDEDIFRSTVSCLAAQLGASAVAHLGLGQLQGASLDLAAEYIDEALLEEGGSALFVAVERWPLPYPRIWDGQVMADGAVALWFVRSGQRGLQYLGGLQQGSDPFLSGTGETGPRVERAALEAAAADVIDTLLQARGLAPQDIDGWIGCALDAAIDRRLQQRFGPAVRHRVPVPRGIGNVGTVTAPALLVLLLQQVAAGGIPHGSRLLSWNASLGGTVTASLWRVCDQESTP